MTPVALTFDDGPSEWTEQILDVLAAHRARATFFVIGTMAESRAELVRRIASEGNEVGNHTWSHPRLARDCDDARVFAELKQTSDLLEEMLGSPPRRFRAPYHDVDARVEAVAASIGLEHTTTTVTAPDWHPGAAAAFIATMVLQRVGAGAVIGLHDGFPPDEADASRDATVAAVATLVPRLVERGFECVTASTLLAQPDR
jgi:peptidoglycan/xylan/chitin deacetylase (PgdA/CDA1 family)